MRSSKLWKFGEHTEELPALHNYVSMMDHDWDRVQSKIRGTDDLGNDTSGIGAGVTNNKWT